MGPRARRPLAAFAASLVLVVAADAAPPNRVFVPGQSLGGAKLGLTRDQISRLWGPQHGVCRSCTRTTWYFNETPFAPQGVGVTFRRGHAVALFTVWKPTGWHTPSGLTLGDPVAEVTLSYGALARRLCSGYAALVQPGRRAQSIFYLEGDVLWGFGLTTPRASPCR